MDFTKVLAGALEVGTILLDVLDAVAVDGDGTGNVLPTGNIEWTGNGFGYPLGEGGYIYAYNAGSTPTTITFIDATATSCPTDLITIYPGYTSDVTSTMVSYAAGSVTVAPNQTTADTDVPDSPRFASFVVQGLGLGISAQVFEDVGVTVTGGDNPSLVFETQSTIQSGTFVATIVNGSQSATVEGGIDQQSSLVFPLPAFLNLEGDPITQFQLELNLVTDANFVAPKKAAKTFKGRPQAKPRRKRS
jgi:hypothetical protein